MLGLFEKPRFLEADVEDWMLQAWAWLLAGQGRAAGAHETPRRRLDEGRPALSETQRPSPGPAQSH
jgi:hypothetical protein